MKLAITGGTGFVGSHLIAMAAAAGHQVRALTRRPQPARDGVEWSEGALDRPDSLAALVQGCDAVVHVAGIVNGDRAAFVEGNIAGTENMVEAAAQGGVRRFLYISSLAAREPQLSTYGWSKCVSEEPVIAAGLNWTILRPPAIYGPGDRDLLELFRLARLRVVPLPSKGRMSLIHVADLCRLILACLDNGMSFGRTYEPDDGRPGGWGTAELAGAIGRAVGRRVLPLPIPRRMMMLGASADRLVRRRRARLTADRVAYFSHPDWTAAPHAHPPADLWQAEVETQAGLAATARWYRANGWL
jgi:nucleoside-diphosphate-sugar epimerase